MSTFKPISKQSNVTMNCIYLQMTRSIPSQLHFPSHRRMSMRFLAASVITKAAAAADKTPTEKEKKPPTERKPPTDPSVLPKVILKGGKIRLFTEHQSPTVYGGAVDRVLGRPTPKAGDIVTVCNGAEEPFAWGLYNPISMYRVRIMQTLDDVDNNVERLEKPNLSAILTARIQAAVALRAALGLPKAEITNVYRLINSEGDRLSGLVVDVLGNVATVQASAAWVEKNHLLIEDLLKSNVAQVQSIVWRQAAELTAEEGWINEQGDTSVEDQEEDQEEGKETTASNPVAVEAGLKFLVDPTGQKTGFYCDQRDHRAFIRSISANKDVLDVCCYSGGFALNAAAGGAASALGIDSSAPAVDLATKNAELNEFSGICSFEKADAAEYMKRAGLEGKNFDVVVLDPPKLAPSKKSLQGAWRKYEALNASAMRLVRPGGVLMTCSCSGAVAQSGEFIPMLQRAAKRAQRRVTLVRSGSAAGDHPLDPGYPEGLYLTNITLIVN
jgi:23S rRNA G2069 N7-methylase RlmK/C1962 C5-methylase RlmI